MSDKHHRRPQTGGQPGGAPLVGRPMPRSAEASQKLWKSLQDVTSKVAPQVSSSLKEIGSSTKEVWLDPLREITRDIAGDVREAFRPGGASEAHAALRAAAADSRATPRNVAAARVPAASVSESDAVGASGGFRGGIGWEPTPPKPPSAGERLESIFAEFADGGEDDTDLEAAERGASASRRELFVPGEIEEDLPSPPSADDSLSASALLRDETKDAFSRLGALRRGDDEEDSTAIGALIRRATKTPGAAVACAAVAATLVVAFVLRDHAARSKRMVDAGGVGGEPGVSAETPPAETPPPPLPP